MDDITSSPMPPNAEKWAVPNSESPAKKPLNLKGSQFMMPTPPDVEGLHNVTLQTSSNNDERDRTTSPAPSSVLSSIIEVASSTGMPDSSLAAGPLDALSATPGPPPLKKRKLTPLEKLDVKQAKEAKDREKAEARARKEEEKARKDEEKIRMKELKDEQKRLKDDETRKKAEEREVKKREKELAEERKTQEKLKKERSQMRLGAFFQHKATTPVKSNDGTDDTQVRGRPRSPSLEHYDDYQDQLKNADSLLETGLSTSLTPPLATEKTTTSSKPPLPDYYKAFLPFELQSYSHLPPLPHHIEAAQHAFDADITSTTCQPPDKDAVSPFCGNRMAQYFADERKLCRGIPYPKTKDVLDAIQGTSLRPIDLDDDGRFETPLGILRQIPIRHIHFEEDVRPPYCGTCTKITSPTTKQKISRNPFTLARQDVDYSYDSEAEWEPCEEGDEDVNSDDEDEVDSQPDADDEGFLDDEDDALRNKRKIITGELIPESTGLCWAGMTGRIDIVDGVEMTDPPEALKGMRMGILIPVSADSGIDPFSRSYWENTGKTESGQDVSNKLASSTLMAPPRVPLQPRPNGSGAVQKILSGVAEGDKGPITSIADHKGQKRGRKPTPRALSQEDLDAFKAAVVGSDVGKLDLHKSLKTRFPKFTNEIIKDTLSTQFAQIGKTKAEKRWVFVGEQ